MPRGGRKYQVYVDPGARGRARARAAVRAINRQVGREVAEIVHNIDKADVVIRMGDPGEGLGGRFIPNQGGVDTIVLDPRGNRARRQEGRQFDTPLRRNLTMHEIGHGMGLRHNEGRTMNVMQSEAISGDFSAAQERKLRERFRQGKFFSEAMGFPAEWSAAGGHDYGIVERRQVVIDYTINVPNGPPRQMVAPIVQRIMDRGDYANFQDLVDAVRRELIRMGSRNSDVFGGRA